MMKQNNGKQFLQHMQHIKLFSVAELLDLERQIADEDLTAPALATLSEWKFNSKSRFFRA